MQHDSEAGLSAWSTELDMRLNDASLSPAYRRRGRRKKAWKTLFVGGRWLDTILFFGRLGCFAWRSLQRNVRLSPGIELCRCDLGVDVMQLSFC